MGQTYTIEAKLNFTDEEGFCKSIQQTMMDMIGRVDFGELEEDDDITTPWGCFQFICPNADTYGDGIWFADFDASYGWEGVMLEIFNKAFDYVKNGSYIKIYPDEGVDVIRRVKGETRTY